jgi:hypothetical protein
MEEKKSDRERGLGWTERCFNRIGDVQDLPSGIRVVLCFTAADFLGRDQPLKAIAQLQVMGHVIIDQITERNKLVVGYLGTNIDKWQHHWRKHRRELEGAETLSTYRKRREEFKGQ